MSNKIQQFHFTWWHIPTVREDHFTFATGKGSLLIHFVKMFAAYYGQSNFKVTEECYAVVYLYCQRWKLQLVCPQHTSLQLATANKLDIFGQSGLKMLLLFIKDDEGTLPNATFVLALLLIQFRVSSLL